MLLRNMLGIYSISKYIFLISAQIVSHKPKSKTWGGLVGIWDVPGLIDGGGITAPRGGFFNTDGEWDVENKGIAPDIEVDPEPKLIEQGRDPQLEKAVEVCLELLKTQGVLLKQQPPDPVKARKME